MKVKKVILLILGIAINLFIWYQSSLPAEVSGGKSDFVTEIVVDALDRVNIEVDKLTVGQAVRKLAHLTEFFFFGLIWCLFFLTIKPPQKALFITFHYGAIVALTDEIIQHFVPGRAMLVTDVMIDLGGVTLALLICFIVILIKNKYSKNKRKKGYSE